MDTNFFGRQVTKKVVTNKKKLLPPVQRTKIMKQKERWDIKCLPTDWDPVKKPSIILKRYRERKQKEHEDVVNEMNYKRQVSNSIAEQKIREQAEFLKRYLNETQKEIRYQLEVTKNANVEDLKIQNKYFDNTLKFLYHQHKIRKKKIKYFYNFLLKVEEERANEFREIIKTAFQKMNKVGFLLPSEIEKFFEDEIANINEITLANIRLYGSLFYELVCRTENSMRKSINDFIYFKEKWFDSMKVKTINKYNEEKFTSQPSALIDKEVANIVTEKFETQDTKLNFLWKSFDPTYLRSKDLFIFSKQVENTINKFDYYAVNLLKMYKVTLVGVFNGYFEGVKHLTTNLMDFGLVEPQEVDLLEQEFCLPIIEKATKHYNMELLDLQNVWNNVINDLQDKLKKTFVFLFDLSHIWDDHFERLDFTQDLVLRDLQKTIERNDRTAQHEEMKLNIYLDSVRQGTKETIDEPMKIILNMLDKMKEMYHNHYDSEVAVIMKYDELSRLAGETLTMRLKQFLHFNPKGKHPSTVRVSTLSRTSLANQNNETTDLIPKQIKMCQLHIDAVENWMLGLWEAIDACLQSSKRDMEEQANEWIKSNLSYIKKRLEIKIALHQPRYITIKDDTYDIRRAKLKLLQDRMERHTWGIDEIVEKMQKVNENSEITYSTIINDCKLQIENTIEKIKSAKNKNVLVQITKEINTFFENYQEKVNSVLKGNLKKVEEMKIITKESQLKFMKNIFLFSDAGNVHVEEGKQLMSELKSLDKKINKKSEQICNSADKLFAKYVNVLKNCRSNLQKVVNISEEEFEFYENFTNKIKDVQVNIKRFAFDLKFKIKQLAAHYADMKTIGQKEMGKLDYLDNYEYDANKITSLCVDLYKYLMIPENLKYLTGKIFKEEYFKTETDDDQEIQTIDVNTDYISIIYNEKPIENETFISKICSCIYKTFQDVQEYSRDFYSSHKEILNSGLLHKSYEEFIKEVVNKFLFYHMQVDFLWIEEVNVFTKVFEDIKELFANLIPSFLLKFKQNAIANFKKSFEECSENLNEIKKTKRKTFQSLYNKLKPLYGHPYNKKKLDELNDEVTQFLSNTCDNFHEVFKICLVNLKQQEENFRKDLTTINETLTLINKNLNEYNIAEDLIQEKMDKVAIIKKLKLPFKDETMAIKKLKEFKKQLSSIQVTTIKSEVDTIDSRSTQTHLDIQECTFAKCLEDFNSVFQDLIKKIEYKETTYAINLIDIWKADVQNVCKLYNEKHGAEKFKNNVS